MNKKGLVLLFCIFLIILILNMITPLISDDYFVAFIWPEGLKINETLPLDARKISSFSDVLVSLNTYYFSWGGRIPGQGFIDLFSWWGKEIFNFVNAFMAVLLIVLIYWISDEGRISLDFKPTYIFWIFFSLWSFNVAFVDTFLWLSGSCEYLWMMVFLLLFLIPYVQNYCNPERLKKDTISLSLSMFFLGLVAGCSREVTVCWIIILLTYWILLCKRDHNLQTWKVSGYIGLCVGYAILLFAPGNSGRIALWDKMTQKDALSIIYYLLDFKLMEFVVILFFHLFLWSFIISFFSKNIINITEKYVRWLNLAKISTAIALCSGLLMIFIPSSGLRISFINLCFLIIAVTFLFRIQFKTGLFILGYKTIKFMKFLGYVYLCLTVLIALWGNYSNWKDWNRIIEIVKREQKVPTNQVLVVDQYSTKLNSSFWVIGSGNHIVWNPLANNENNGINKSFSKYYNISGIRVR